MADKIKWHMAGFRALRNDRAVMSDLIRRANAVAAAAGPGNEVRPVSGKNRSRVVVVTTTTEARLDNARNNSLVRALNSGR